MHTRNAGAANNAASAAANAIAGGGGGCHALTVRRSEGSTYQIWHGDQQYDKYKLDERGNIVSDY